jgi:hypothetical protein
MMTGLTALPATEAAKINADPLSFASDIDTVVVGSLNALDLEWPIREAEC